MPAPLIVSALSLALLLVAGALQRKAAATMLSCWFWIGGIALWLYCLVVIDALLGIWWLVVGIMLFGVGVYPVALIAALIRGEWMIFGDVGVALVVLGFVRSRAHENKTMSEDQNPTLTGARSPSERENKVQKAMDEISHRSETQPEPSPDEQHRDWQTNSDEQLESKEEYANAATFGTEGYLKLKISLGKEPTREQWQEEFLYHIGIATGEEYLLDKLWKDVLAASMEYERLQGRKPVSEVLEQIFSREPPKTAPPPAANIVKIQQSTKVIVPKAEGYRETMLESMLRCMFFPSSFFDQPVPVRGVCFAAGPDSSQLARNFAERRLGLAVFSINHEAATKMAWIEMSRVFAHPQTTSSRMGILLPNLDCTSVEAQQQIVKAVQTANNLLWFPSADDYRKVIPALRLALVVYLGLNAGNKMQVLVQSGQTLEIDQGSLEHPDLN